MITTKYSRGLPVSIGTKVRILKINPSIIEDLSSSEKNNVISMQGEVLEVYEIDDWGFAWVKKWWPQKSGKAFSHSISLAPDEMEAQETPKSDA